MICHVTLIKLCSFEKKICSELVVYEKQDYFIFAQTLHQPSATIPSLSVWHLKVNQHTWCGFYIHPFFTAVFLWCKHSQKWDCCRNVYTLTMEVLNKFVSCFWLIVSLLENRACKVTHQEFSVDLSLNLASAPACPLSLSFKCNVWLITTWLTDWCDYKNAHW